MYVQHFKNIPGSNKTLLPHNLALLLRPLYALFWEKSLCSCLVYNFTPTKECDLLILICYVKFIPLLLYILPSSLNLYMEYERPSIFWVTILIFLGQINFLFLEIFAPYWDALMHYFKKDQSFPVLHRVAKPQRLLFNLSIILFCQFKSFLCGKKEPSPYLEKFLISFLGQNRSFVLLILDLTFGSYYGDIKWPNQWVYVPRWVTSPI